MRYGYDTAGRRTSLATTRDGATWDVTRWAYDAETGLCTSKTYADGSAVAYTQAPDGLPLRTAYASGRWTESGNIVRYVSEAGNIAARYAYDPYGNMTGRTGRRGHTGCSQRGGGHRHGRGCGSVACVHGGGLRAGLRADGHRHGQGVRDCSQINSTFRLCGIMWLLNSGEAA